MEVFPFVIEDIVYLENLEKHQVLSEGLEFLLACYRDGLSVIGTISDTRYSTPIRCSSSSMLFDTT